MGSYQLGVRMGALAADGSIIRPLSQQAPKMNSISSMVARSPGISGFRGYDIGAVPTHSVTQFIGMLFDCDQRLCLDQLLQIETMAFAAIALRRRWEYPNTMIHDSLQLNSNDTPSA